MCRTPHFRKEKLVSEVRHMPLVYSGESLTLKWYCSLEWESPNTKLRLTCKFLRRIRLVRIYRNLQIHASYTTDWQIHVCLWFPTLQDLGMSQGTFKVNNWQWTKIWSWIGSFATGKNLPLTKQWKGPTIQHWISKAMRYLTSVVVMSSIDWICFVAQERYISGIGTQELTFYCFL